MYLRCVIAGSACCRTSAVIRADKPASSNTVATNLRKLYTVTSWTASWRAQRWHCSNEAQCMTIDVRLTGVAAESSLSYSGVVGPVTRVSAGEEGRASRPRDAEAAA